MKKIILLILLTLSLPAASLMIREEYDPKPMVEGNRRVDELIEWNKNHPGEMPPLTEQERYEIFIKNGIPLPGTGATVVDRAKVKNFKMTKEHSGAINKFNADQDSKGYHEMIVKKAKMLLSMPEIAEIEFNERRFAPYDPHDTHLYEVKSNLAMSYPYKGVPANLASKVIAFAPEHTFVNDGWTGAVEFFIPSFGGICAYHEINIEITKTAAYIPKEIVTYAINNKITKMNAMGQEGSGFVYEIEWWDKRFKRNLECASIHYLPNIKDSMTKLARRIDSANEQ